MTTLITAYDPEGNFIGYCDATCYHAKKPTCKCICGGMNHGKGLRGAADAMMAAHTHLQDSIQGRKHERQAESLHIDYDLLRQIIDSLC